MKTRKYRTGKSQGSINEGFLIDYLEGRLPAGEQHRLEMLMEEDPFLQDAIEGLSGLPDKRQITRIALQINAQIKRQTHRKRRSYISFIDQKLLIWATALLLILLIFAAWWIIRSLPEA